MLFVSPNTSLHCVRTSVIFLSYSLSKKKKKMGKGGQEGKKEREKEKEVKLMPFQE